MMTSKSYFFRCFIIGLGLFLLPATIVVVFDPFFKFHKPFIHKDLGFDGTDRYQNIGLINSYLADKDAHFDTVIIGTSMTQNFPVTGIINDHGQHALKITLSGGRARELAMLAKKSLETGQVKHMIWGVYNSYMHDDPSAMHPESPLPLFLYNDTIWDDWRYVFNNDVVEEALKAAIGKKKKRRPLETLYGWDLNNEFPQFVHENNIEERRQKIADKYNQITIMPRPADEIFPNVDENLLNIIRQYPQVKFSIFFPMPSYYSWINTGAEHFSKSMTMRRYVLENIQDMDHVTAYSFDLTHGWASNIDNYKDSIHHSPWISKQQLQYIQQGKGRLDLSAFDKYVDRLTQALNEWRL